MKIRHLSASSSCSCTPVRHADAASAQWVVYDPTNYAQAVATLSATGAAVPAPAPAGAAAARRPRGAVPGADAAVAIARHVADYAEPLLHALNQGDPTGTSMPRPWTHSIPCRRSWLRFPPPCARASGPATPRSNWRTASPAPPCTGRGLRTQGVERPPDDSGPGGRRRLGRSAVPHARSRCSTRSTAPNVLGLRIAEQTSQSRAHVVEQLLVANKRQRDAETKQMNAQLYQWQYGPGLWRRTSFA